MNTLLKRPLMALNAFCLMMLCVCVAFTRVPILMNLYCDSGPCGPGEYLAKDSLNCLPCPKGFFMPLNRHACLSCKRCSVANYYNQEVLKQTCTSTSDTDIVCKPGYFRYPFGSTWTVDDDCNRCTRCGHRQIELEPCTEYRDTVCQAKPIKRSDPEPKMADVEKL